jgi:ankyrin repeat protein
MVKLKNNNKKIIIIVGAIIIIISIIIVTKNIYNEYHFNRLIMTIYDEDIKSFSKELSQVKNLNNTPSNSITVFFSDRYDETPLQAACYAGNLNMVKSLIDHGADPDYVISKVAPVSPLMCVVEGDRDHPDKKYIEIAKYLILIGADVNYKMNEDGAVGVTALFKIVDCKNPSPNAREMICLLCNNGANINDLTPYGTVMHCACLYGHNDLICFIIRNYQVDLNIQQSDSGMTCLMYFCKCHDNEEIVKELLDAGSDPLITDFFGKTAYDYAYEEGNLNIASVLSSYN